jgi:hypothetical chaperone protein
MGIGLDFGTTNSSLACARSHNAVDVLEVRDVGGWTASFRSLLYLERVLEGHKSVIRSWSGPAGIERYLEGNEKGRLIQSLKSFLASKSLQSTEVFGRRFKLEELIARMLRDIRMHAEARFGPVRNVTVGRPVRFVGAESSDDDAYATERLESALHSAGFEEVTFEYEPVGAAWHYASTLDHDEVILIGDFGGGTSDFSLLRVGPHRGASSKREVIANEGLGLAGDSFDAKIIRHLISPELGAGTELRSGDKLLPVPNWVYFKLERWHHLSFLKSAETMNLLRSVSRQALEPEKINLLIYLVEHDLGFQLHRAVQQVKTALSSGHEAVFRFVDGDSEISAHVKRAEFESWIAEELEAIESKIDSLLLRAGVERSEVDKVFLTGGTSFVPAVRRIFETRFGAAKIQTGDEFTSVASGLALTAFETERHGGVG